MGHHAWPLGQDTRSRPGMAKGLHAYTGLSLNGAKPRDDFTALLQEMHGRILINIPANHHFTSTHAMKDAHIHCLPPSQISKLSHLPQNVAVQDTRHDLQSIRPGVTIVESEHTHCVQAHSGGHLEGREQLHGRGIHNACVWQMRRTWHSKRSRYAYTCTDVILLGKSLDDVQHQGRGDT
eukprot:585203-Pelagomonas_calceolata.AAC.1